MLKSRTTLYVAAGVGALLLIAVAVHRQQQRVTLSGVPQEDGIDTTGPTPTTSNGGHYQAPAAAITLGEYLDHVRRAGP